MANIEISGLPEIFQLNTGDYLHTANTLDVNSKTPTNEISDSKNLRFNPAITGLSSTNVEDAINEGINTGFPNITGQYYDLVDSGVTVTVGPGGDFATIEAAIETHGRAKASEAFSGQSPNLITIQVINTYVWSGTVKIDGSQVESSVVIILGTLDQNFLVPSYVDYPLFEVCGGANLALNTKLMMSSIYYFLDFSSAGINSRLVDVKNNRGGDVSVSATIKNYSGSKYCINILSGSTATITQGVLINCSDIINVNDNSNAILTVSSARGTPDTRYNLSVSGNSSVDIVVQATSGQAGVLGALRVSGSSRVRCLGDITVFGEGVDQVVEVISGSRLSVVNNSSSNPSSLLAVLTLDKGVNTKGALLVQDNSKCSFGLKFPGGGVNYIGEYAFNIQSNSKLHINTQSGVAQYGTKGLMQVSGGSSVQYLGNLSTSARPVGGVDFNVNGMSTVVTSATTLANAITNIQKNTFQSEGIITG